MKHRQRKPSYILLEFVSIDSTQDEIKRRLNSLDISSRPSLAIIAEEQTKGRGRQGRKWLSPKGKNIYLTIALPLPTAFQSQQEMLCPVVSLALCDYISMFGASSPVKIKWPNDILIDEKKVAGILIEVTHLYAQSEINHSNERAIPYALIGIGINLNMTDEECSMVKEREITSIYSQTGIHTDIGRETKRVIEKVLDALYCEDEDSISLSFDEWVKKISWMIGEEVSTHGKNGEIKRGIVESITEEGLLVIKDPSSGKKETISSGL